MGVVISTLIRLYVARSSLRIICRIQSACLFRKSVEISLKLNESDQSNGLFALRVRIFEAQIEGFLENPIRPLWVDSGHFRNSSQKRCDDIQQISYHNCPALTYQVKIQVIIPATRLASRCFLVVSMRFSFLSRTSLGNSLRRRPVKRAIGEM